MITMVDRAALLRHGGGAEMQQVHARPRFNSPKQTLFLKMDIIIIMFVVLGGGVLRCIYFIFRPINPRSTLI